MLCRFIESVDADTSELFLISAISFHTTDVVHLRSTGCVKGVSGLALCVKNLRQDDCRTVLEARG